MKPQPSGSNLLPLGSVLVRSGNCGNQKSLENQRFPKGRKALVVFGGRRSIQLSYADAFQCVSPFYYFGRGKENPANHRRTSHRRVSSAEYVVDSVSQLTKATGR